MTPDMLRAKGFQVDFPGQIPQALIRETFSRNHTIHTDIVSASCPVTGRNKVNNGVSRFTEDQRSLIYVANMSLLGLMRGEVYGEVKPPQARFVDHLFKALKPEEGPVSTLVDAMVKASKEIVVGFDQTYPVLTPVLFHELRNIGANGMATAIIEAEKNSVFLPKTRFRAIYHEIPGMVECLGPQISRQMMSDADTAIQMLQSRFGESPAKPQPTGSESIAAQIMSVFPEIAIQRITDRQSKEVK